MMPFYVATHPASARALLGYRYHTLSAAREKARAAGFRGAMYAWESADTGQEVTPKMAITPSGRRHTHSERGIGSAYNRRYCLWNLAILEGNPR